MRAIKNLMVITSIVGLMTFAAPTARAGFFDWLGCALSAGFGYMGCGISWVGGATLCAAESIDINWVGFVPTVGVDNEDFDNCMEGEEEDPGPGASFNTCASEVGEQFEDCME